MNETHQKSKNGPNSKNGSKIKKNGSKAKNESTEEMDKIQMKNLSLCFGVR